MIDELVTKTNSYPTRSDNAVSDNLPSAHHARVRAQFPSPCGPALTSLLASNSNLVVPIFYVGLFPIKVS